MLNTPIKYLKGVGPRRADILSKEIGINSYADMLGYFPTHYIDRSAIHTIRSFSGEMPHVQVKGRFISLNTVGEGAKTRLTGLFSDGTGTMEVVWFRRIKWIKNNLTLQKEYLLFGKPTVFNNRWSMTHPETDSPDSSVCEAGLRGVYPLTEKLRNAGITSKQLLTYASAVLDIVKDIKDPLPAGIVEQLKLMPYAEALYSIHKPHNMQLAQKARERLKFQELFMLQLNIQRYSCRRKNEVKGFVFRRIGRYFNDFYTECLPFSLTGAQKRVLHEIRNDLGSGRQMNRLLQGDVGSGKTLVALMTMLIALDNGKQACLMAPTEILAAQHYDTLSKLVAPLGINIKLLTGSTPAKTRRTIYEQLGDNSLHILVGTHALIEDNVQFKSLGVAVIDEQHRFGVAQRAKLWGKSSIPPHILVMTATPIPRTLAMTVYGDLDVSVIDELPPGRKPVVTLLRHSSQRLSVYQGITRQLLEGRQAYIVYPVIKENEKTSLNSLEEGVQIVRETFRHFNVTYLHGKMRPEEKERRMQQFVSGEAHILVSTTVIEVGVNVPNATIMLIENPERFGLSQLHQLRGRVGRGSGQSYCILLAGAKLSSDTRKRLEIMTSTTDGFKVAEADMALRGPGDIEGTMQSGMALNLRIASLATDGQLVQLARDASAHFLEKDPTLTTPEGQILSRQLRQLFPNHIDWSSIS